jgi:ABC-2 type transport system ATP-binding protein
MIQFTNVSKTFRRTPVLDDITLQIRANHRVALVGSNGAGKTTLIRCLLGEYVFDGSVTLDGKDVRAKRTEILKRVGFVPQLPPPLKMPVGQLMSFAAGVCNSDVNKMYAVANDLGLDADAFRKQPFVKLSGGQKQKLLIAIALGRECRLLVMDEPAANLDPDARHVLFKLLAKKQQDTAMIISSHRLDEVAALVNRVIELDQGHVVLDDHVADAANMDSVLECQLSLYQANSAFAETIREWGFKDTQEGKIWQGLVSGPDRLRFLGVLSRYTGLLKGIHLEEPPNHQVAINES